MRGLDFRRDVAQQGGRVRILEDLLHVALDCEVATHHGRDGFDLAVDQPAPRLVSPAEPESDVAFGGILDAHRELELIDAVAGAGAGASQLLADELPAALRVGWALVVEVTADARCRLIARGESAPMWEGGEVSVLCGLERVTALDDDDDGVPAEWTAMDTSLAAAPLNSGHILVVGRPGGPSFRPSEVARLGYLTGILRSLDAG